MMDRKPFETNGNNVVGVSYPASAKSPAVEPTEEFSGLRYVDIEEGQPPRAERPKAAGGKRRRLARGLLVLAMLALVAVAFFWIVGGGKKKIDLPVRDRSAQAEQPAPQKIDDMTAQAIAEVRGGAPAAPSPSSAGTTSVDTATARDTAPAPIPLGGTEPSVERPPAPIPPGVSSTGAPARPPETVSRRNTERSIRCAPVKKDVTPQSKRPATPDFARAPVKEPAPGLEKTVALPPFGALLPVRTLGTIYTLRPSVSRFELTRDLQGDGWTMKKGTILVGRQSGSELDRAYMSLTGFIDPNSGKFVRLAGDLLGADGAPGLRGKRRRIGGRWARVLSRAAGAAVTLGQAALSRGGTIVNVPNAVTPELQGFTSSAINSREFVEAPAGAAAFVLITDLPKEVRGVDPQPGADDGGESSLGDEELARLLTGGSPEQIRAALPRMTPELRQVAEAVLRETNNTDVAEESRERKR